jgi:signal transduction histidine kinase
MISSLAELNDLTVLDEIRIATVHIEGTVWWSSKTEGRVILNDDTATLQLELDVPCEFPELGDRLIIEGGCTAIKARDYIKLSGVPVVDHGGLHPPEEKSGTIYLKAGRHPFRVAWFNRTGRFGLDVRYEGPEITRQTIPDHAFYHLSEDPISGATNYAKGLRYSYYEGLWWNFLPNFNHMIPAADGVADNLDIELRRRNDNVGLKFAGYIKVPRDGDYTFHLQSDDGSRLFIGDSSLRVRMTGHHELPTLPTLPREDRQTVESEYRWSEIEGIVTSFQHLPGALELGLMTEAGPVRLKLAEDSEDSFILRPQNRIRVVGVSRRILNLDGEATSSEFYAQHWNDVEQVYITPTIWDEYPLSRIGDLLTMSPSEIDGTVVHLSAKIVKGDAEQGWVVADETGRILLEGYVPDELAGNSAEVLGLLRIDGTNSVLHCSLFNRLQEPQSETASLPVLTTAAEVCQLSLEEAAREYPVRLRGVITSPNEFEGAVFEDATRGIYLWFPMPADVSPEEWRPPAPQVGDYCEIEGITGLYGFDPYVQVLRIQKLGAGALPAPVQPTWDQLINGTLHCKYVELEGVVTSINDDTISLLTRDGRINVRLNPLRPAMPPDALGATILLQGALLSDWDEASRQVVVGSIYLDHQRVTMVHPAPADPFAIPLKRIGDILQFDPEGGALRRVKVSGVLLHSDPELSYLMDGEKGLRFMPAEEVFAQVGDHVEVVGFSDLSGPSPLLRDALVRRVGPSGLPEPRRLKAGELLRDEYDSTMVQVDGTLLSVSRRQDSTILEMQSGLRRFLALLDDSVDTDKVPPSGSHLELTGIFAGLGGNRVLGRPIDSFQLHINSIHDIHILSRPSWWTFRRLMLVVVVLILVLMAALVWIELLHRKVEQRTQQLGTQIRKRQRAEQQREIELERARLAHDLHDDLGAGLTEVNMLSSLLNNPSTPTEEKERYASEMNELAMRMVTSLDEIVWAENPSNDTVASLAGYFGAYAQRFMELASVSCGLDVAEDLPDCALDPGFRRELFLAFKEALTNVIKHADATKVWLRIRIQDENIAVTVSDNGCGVLPDAHEPGADGLISMRQRLKALGGDCDIESDPEKGTVVCLKAPLQEVGK